MKLIEKDIKDLNLAPYNPRQISDKEMEKLKKSIDKWGYVEPIIVNTRNNVVVGGNQRLKALKELGETKVKVIEVDLDDANEKALNIALNKISGEWEEEKLAELLSGLDNDLIDLAGFEEKETAQLLDSLREPEEDNFDSEQAQKKPKYKVERGEIWNLGEHRLLYGDATVKEDVEKLMGGEKARLCFTSPPYNMAGGMYENYEDNLQSEEYINFNLKVIENVKQFLKGFIFWNISYNKNARWEFIEIIHRIIKETGLKFLELIIWDKGHALPITSKEGLTRQYEDILLVGDEESISNDLELYFLGRNDKKAYFNKKNQKGITNYWRIGTNKVQLTNHLACFPVALPRKGIELMTDRRDIVMDLFGGSGSTLIACEQLNRKCFMMEIDPTYCSVIIERWENLTNKKAELTPQNIP